MSVDIFPILLACNEKGWSAHAFQRCFYATKPEDLTWFGYDTTILSQTEVEFTVYDMADNATGGLGDKIASFRATVPEELTKEAVDRKILFLALAQRERELRAIEEAIINRYADAIRASSLSRPKSGGPDA